MISGVPFIMNRLQQAALFSNLVPCNTSSLFIPITSKGTTTVIM